MFTRFVCPRYWIIVKVSMLSTFLLLSVSGFPSSRVPLSRTVPIMGDIQESENVDTYSIGGYASQLSIAPNQKINFHISTDLTDNYDLNIWREGTSRQHMLTIENLVPHQYDCDGGYASGCGWPVGYVLQIPASWPTGVYTVDIPVSSGKAEHIIFWVRELMPGAGASALLLSAVNTYNAYNAFGGKSLYNFGSSENVRATKVSFERPFQSRGTGQFNRWEVQLVEWAERSGYPLAYATTADIEFFPELLTHYPVVIIAGHSEYWTWTMRERMKDFITGGGRLINLSGNTMWWQVRYEDDGRTMVGYKDYRSDPATVPQAETDYPWDYPIFDAEYSVIGISYHKGGLPGEGGLTYDNGYAGYAVHNANHWVFEGTNVKDQDIIGRTASIKTTIFDKEADGTSFNCETDGRTIRGPQINMGTPENFTILGIGPVARGRLIGFGVFGIYTNVQGGAVFSAGTTGWTHGLGIDSVVTGITHNVLTRFLDRQTPLPQELKASSDADLLFYDRFNCNNLQQSWPQSALEHWKTIAALNYMEVAEETKFQYAMQCGVDGSGLAITADDQNDKVFTSQVKPNWQGTNRLYARLYVNLSNLTVAKTSILISYAWPGMVGTVRLPKPQHCRYSAKMTSL